MKQGRNNHQTTILSLERSSVQLQYFFLLLLLLLLQPWWLRLITWWYFDYFEVVHVVVGGCCRRQFQNCRHERVENDTPSFPAAVIEKLLGEPSIAFCELAKKDS